MHNMFHIKELRLFEWVFPFERTPGHHGDFQLFIAKREPVLSIGSTRHPPPGTHEIREGQPIRLTGPSAWGTRIGQSD